MDRDYKDAKKLLKKEATYPTFVYSVLDNFITGQIHMDESRRTMIIGTDSGLFFVEGDIENSAFNNLLLDIYMTKKRENKRFTLFSPSKEWDEVISKLFERKLRRIFRYSFCFNIDESSRLARSEESKKASRINNQIISVSNGFKEAYYNEYWGTVENFLEKGFGYCINDNETVASECVSIFTSNKFAEIDIETQEKYRGMGLAQKVAREFIEHCIAYNVSPRWDCNIDNIASIKLAHKLGFENAKEYSLYF